MSATYPVPTTIAEALRVLDDNARSVVKLGYGLEGRLLMTGEQCLAIAALIRRSVTVAQTLLDGPAGWAERSLMRSIFEPLTTEQAVRERDQLVDSIDPGRKAMHDAVEAAYADAPRPMPDVG